MNFQRILDFLVRLSLFSVFCFPSWGWSQTPFNFSEIHLSSPQQTPKKFNAKSSPLIPLRRVYKNEENRGVYYFNSFEQKNAQVVIREGLFYKAIQSDRLINRHHASPLLLPQITPPPPASKAKSMGYAIFVFDQNHQIYLSFKAKQGKIHHSSLLAGAPIICAGEMQIFQGQLKYINNRSGHYQPPPRALKVLLHFLEKQDVNLKDVKVEFLGVDL